MRRPVVRLAFLLLCLCAAVPAVRAGEIYWDYPQILERSGVRFPVAASGDGVLAVCWQEFERAFPAATSGNLWISVAVTRDG